MLTPKSNENAYFFILQNLDTSNYWFIYFVALIKYLRYWKGKNRSTIELSQDQRSHPDNVWKILSIVAINIE